MDSFSHRKQVHRLHGRRSWCCSFTVPPASPDNPVIIKKSLYRKPESTLKPGPISVPSSPKSGLNLVGRIDRRRILSPGRVSPIESDKATDFVPEPVPDPSPPAGSAPKSRSDSFRGVNDGFLSRSGSGHGDVDVFDVRLNLRGRKGGGLVLEMSSEVLIANSEVMEGLILEYRRGLGSKRRSGSTDSSRVCRIEVPDVENLEVFRETIELMFEEDVSKRLLKLGAFKAIDILEVSAGIKFTKGVSSCLKYLEAVPWTEEEEEKLRSLFAVYKFDEAITQDIRARLFLQNSVDSQQDLAKHLVWSITNCNDATARNELKSLVRGLLCKNSVYEKYQPDLHNEDLCAFCQSCLHSLVSLLQEASEMTANGRVGKKDRDKPLIERISKEVDNINWLTEILLDRQMGEEFVQMWAAQEELIKLHKSASPIVRYELSRISAVLFVAMGTRRLQCGTETRAGLFQTWFRPMLLDFGWLQRCKKGLDMKAVEEAMGQTLLTLPLTQQYTLFMEWFRCFSKCGNDCPNLSKAFQIWWRRSFLKGSETHAIESR
ncbi:hypothetical protein K2173_000993 [Erythroxylum novogranatense]|uniref:At3g05675-like ankyrin-like domain-containing protein n=1 Tax=Erythroxylum novogranatense TaxID=1862640 RepID=A0AAV8TTW8_9ROSI|nr:hypothetical protein K2173_000993 [Erythroxylum novogranatense]